MSSRKTCRLIQLAILMLQFLLKMKVRISFFLLISLVFPLSFTKIDNIWDLSESGIPDMWELGENHQFERSAEIRINIEQQMQLQEMIFPLQKGFIIFCVDILKMIIYYIVLHLILNIFWLPKLYKLLTVMLPQCNSITKYLWRKEPFGR